MTESSPRRRQAPTGEWQYLGADGYWYDDLAMTSSPSPATKSASTKSTSTIPVGAWMAVVGSVAAAIGTLLPWGSASLGFVSVNRNAFQLGTRESVTWTGPVVIILAVVGAMIGIARLTNSSMPRGLQTSALVLGIAMALVVGVSYPTAPSGLSSEVIWSVGFGFWLCVIGAAVVIGGGIVMRSRTSEPTVSDTPVPQGWYPDPRIPGQLRWWNGTNWTEDQTAPQGWYADPGNPGQLRWWNGVQWTDRRRSIQ